MEDNFYNLLRIKGKRICEMANFIDSLEPGIDDVGHIIDAIYQAYALIDAGVPMSIKFLNGVYSAFFNSDKVYYRQSAVRITPPTKKHDPIYKPAKVDFPALLDWCEDYDFPSDSYYDAANLYYGLWSIHPLDDGNKRTAMVLIEAWCYKNNLPSIYIAKKHIRTLKVKLFDEDIDGIARLFEKGY